MEQLKRLYLTGITPVVVLDRAEDAVPTAQALLAGGIDVMEITFRTEAAEDAIRCVARQCPQMLVGAGTIVSVAQCEKALSAGAQFLVSPGYDPKMVAWCLERNICVIPGCVTPSEIMAARAQGLHVLKFFPANLYGGLAGMKALSGPFGDLKFIATGGINQQNLAEYGAAEICHAVGGSWICDKSDIKAGHFEKIAHLCQAARDTLLGYEVAHVGLNCQDPTQALAASSELANAFGFPIREGTSSYFAGCGLEILKLQNRGDKGHIAIATHNVPRAIAALESKGFSVDPASAKYAGEEMIAVYLQQQFRGFAIHLLKH